MNIGTTTSANSSFSGLELLRLVRHLASLLPEERRGPIERLHAVLSPILGSSAELSLLFLGNSKEREACAEALWLMAQLVKDIWSDEVELEYWETAYNISPVNTARQLRPVQLILASKRHDRFATRMLIHAVILCDDETIRRQAADCLCDLLDTQRDMLSQDELRLLATHVPRSHRLLHQLLTNLQGTVPYEQIVEAVGYEKIVCFPEPAYSNAVQSLYEKDAQLAVSHLLSRFPEHCSHDVYLAFAVELVRMEQPQPALSCFSKVLSSDSASDRQKAWAASQYLLIILAHGFEGDPQVIEKCLTPPLSFLPSLCYARGCYYEMLARNESDALEEYQKVFAATASWSKCQQSYAGNMARAGYLLCTRRGEYRLAYRFAKAASTHGEPLPRLDRVLIRIRSDWEGEKRPRATSKLVEKISAEPPSDFRDYVLSLVRLLVSEYTDLEAIDALVTLGRSIATPPKIQSALKRYCLDWINCRRDGIPLPDPGSIILIPWLPEGAFAKTPLMVWQGALPEEAF